MLQHIVWDSISCLVSTGFTGFELWADKNGFVVNQAAHVKQMTYSCLLSRWKVSRMVAHWQSSFCRSQPLHPIPSPHSPSSSSESSSSDTATRQELVIYSITLENSTCKYCSNWGEHSLPLRKRPHVICIWTTNIHVVAISLSCLILQFSHQLFE